MDYKTAIEEQIGALQTLQNVTPCEADWCGVKCKIAETIANLCKMAATL